MDSSEREQALAAARGFEKRGQLESALEIYMRIGAVQEAARVLTSARRYAEAGHLLLQALGVPLEKILTLPADKKKLAWNAAILFGRAGGEHVRTAVDLFMAAGERERAAELLDRSGDTLGAAKLRASGSPRRLAALAASPGTAGAVGGAALNAAAAQKLESGGKLDLAMAAYVQLKMSAEAARIAQKLGRQAQAAELWAEAGRPFEAAECYLQAGDTGKGLDNLVRVPREDPRYRGACQQAIRLAVQLSSLSFALEHFLTRYINEGPRDERDLEAFYLLAKLYTQNDLLENAKEALCKVLAARPGYRDAASRLEALKSDTKASSAVCQKIVEEDAAFRGDAPNSQPLVADALEELPGLPPIPLTELAGETEAAAREAAKPVLPAIAAEGTLVRGWSTAGPRSARPVSANAEKAIAVGSVIASRYRLEEGIGRGGMAVVFRAHDLDLEQAVAIKIFTQAVEDESLVARFKQELKLARGLVHPNIIRLYDIGMHAGCRFLSMELLVGSSLRQMLSKPLSLAQGIGYLIQACAGLQAAHDQGVVHRDVKPDNFFATREGVLKVMDFGIAKHQSHASALTMAGMIAGTPQYISPEQINSFSAVGPPTDIYALGVVAFEMFTGRLPFEHPEVMPLLMMHVNQPPTAPRSLNASIPPELEAVVLKCLAKSAAHRYASCRELAEALEPIRQGLTEAPRGAA